MIYKLERDHGDPYSINANVYSQNSRSRPSKPKPRTSTFSNHSNRIAHNRNINYQNVPSLIPSNRNNHIGAPPQQPNGITNNNNNFDYKNQQQLNGCFIITKAIKAGAKTMPVGTAGKVVLSRKAQGKSCCVFAVPYCDVEAVVNPITHLEFSMFVCMFIRSKQ